ncbi:hypothetical protein Ahy_B06g085439 [Arachis hypogaea]|uniref:Disease resistance R13L4/SHOC-2-like LRR domain-containing protein n=1 Tax=Arachis hypogaea TaxID=3818 RepID=A0A444YUI4_ARAHY|nr:hypothetical protein Ahy_B06g085439 [Arachis hypogaea]
MRLNAAIRKQVANVHGSCTIITKIGSFFSRSNPLIFRFKMAQRIKQVKGKLDKIAADNRVVHRRECIRSSNIKHVISKIIDFLNYSTSSFANALGNLDMEILKNQLKDKLANNKFLLVLDDVSNSMDLIWLGAAEGTGSTFKLHGLVHDYAKSVARTYSQIIISSSFGSRQRWNVRNASFLSNDVTTISATARTILFPIAGVGAASMDFLNALASRCKYLQFLDLSDSTYETLPQSIGNLKHLRYLSLENNKSFKKLPDSICRLHNLEVLILSGCAKLEALPKGLGNLISLRHLEITTNLHCLPEDDIARLSSLQTLRVESCKNLKSLFAKTRLPSLRVLVVSGCSSLRSLPLDIEHFSLLDTLVVDNCDKLELSEGHNDQNSNLRLKVLHFVSMPNLVILPQWLQGCTKTLQYLLVSSCINLVVLPEWLPTMDCIKTLYITNCPNLLSLPNAMHRFATIERFVIDGYPELFRNTQLQVGECSHQQTTIDETAEIEEVVEVELK